MNCIVKDCTSQSMVGYAYCYPHQLAAQPALANGPMKRCDGCGNLFRYPPTDNKESETRCAYCVPTAPDHFTAAVTRLTAEDARNLVPIYTTDQVLESVRSKASVGGCEILMKTVQLSEKVRADLLHCGYRLTDKLGIEDDLTEIRW